MKYNERVMQNVIKLLSSCPNIDINKQKIEEWQFYKTFETEQEY